MAITGTNISNSIQVSVPKKGKFEITFGWTVNAEGKAIRLSEPVTIAEAASRHTMQITLVRELQQIYLKNGIDQIEQNFAALTATYKSKKKENILNSLGYIFLRENAFPEAIEVFALNTRLFPGKVNPWDSLGEAYYKNGEKEKALAAFQKALTIDPKFPSSRSWIGKIKATQ